MTLDRRMLGHRGGAGRESSGQYRVTVPDPDALDRLRTQNRVYDRTLTPRDQFTGSVSRRGTLITRLVKRVIDRTDGYRRGGEKLRAKSWKAYASRGVGYTLTLRGIHYIPTPLCSLPGAGGKGQG